MKKKDKYSGWILFFPLIALVISGCAQKKASPDKILLRWSGYSDIHYNEFRSIESKKFELIHTEVIVKYEPIEGPPYFQSKILTGIAGGVAPDIFFCDDLQSYISKETLVDLTDWVETDKKYFDNIHPALWKAHIWNEKTYAFPGNCNVDILYYNKDIFDQEGLSYPDETWTWQDLLTAAQKLTKRDSRGITTRFGCTGVGQWLLFIHQNGGRLWNQDKTKCIINSPESREALNFWRDLYLKYHVSPTPTEIQSEGGGYYAVLAPFVMGKAAMYCGNSWEIAQFKLKAKKKLNWDATLLPSPPGKKRFYGLAYYSLGVWSGSKHPNLAYELMKFMISPENQRFLVKMGDSLPMYTKGADMDYYLSDPDRPEKAKREMLKALNYAESIYRLTLNPKISRLEQENVITQILDEFTLGSLSAEEALQLIEDKLNGLLNQTK